MKGLEGLMVAEVQEIDLHFRLYGGSIGHLATCWLTKSKLEKDLIMHLWSRDM